MTCVNFINEDIMLRNTYLYENTMVTNKLDQALFGKGKAWEARWGRESVGVNEKFNLHERKKRHLRSAMKDRSKWIKNINSLTVNYFNLDYNLYCYDINCGMTLSRNLRQN